MKSNNRFFIKSFLTNQKGLALVEFALFAPLLLVLFYGVVELTRYAIILQKVERTAYSVSNMVGQYLPAKNPAVDPVNEISVDNLNNNVFAQISKMMDPYNANGDMRAIVTSVVSEGGFPPVIQWQIAGGGTLENGDTVSIANGLAPSAIDASVKGTNAVFNGETRGYLANMQGGENLIAIEVFYDYRPLVSDILTRFGANSLARQTLISRVYTMPRYGNLLTLPPTFP